MSNPEPTPESVPPADFVHLHVHTHYSLLDGAIRLKDLMKTSKAFGMDTVTITSPSRSRQTEGSARAWMLTSNRKTMPGSIHTHTFLPVTRQNPPSPQPIRPRHHFFF